MRKTILTFIGLIFLTCSFGQKDIYNTKTENHIQVPGTKYFMIPPAGFIAATNFQGFQQLNSGASILLLDLPGSFLETTKGFNEEGLKTQGIILKKKEEIKVNGLQGMLLTTEQFAYGTDFKKYILVFGDSNLTTIINGTFPKEVKGLDKDILTSMCSIVYEADLTVDPLSAVSFSVNTENTKLKFAKSMSGSLLYTVDGKVPTESEDKTSFILGMSLSDIQSIDKKLTAINRIKKFPLSELNIPEEQILPVEIDEISGYEIVAEGINSSGIREMIYQVMLFSDSGYYIMIGTTQSDFQNNLDLFKNISRTLKRR